MVLYDLNKLFSVLQICNILAMRFTFTHYICRTEFHKNYTATTKTFFLVLFECSFLGFSPVKMCEDNVVCPAQGETHQGYAAEVNWFLLCVVTVVPAYYIRICPFLTQRLGSVCLYSSDLVVSLPLLSPESSGGSELVKLLLILLLFSSASRIWL